MKTKKRLIRLSLSAMLLFLALLPILASATFEYIPMEKIPGFDNVASADFPNYIVNVFKFGIWITGASAMIMIMIGGYIYMTSAGNNASMEKAKKFITDAIIGLILALFSWLLLYTINPNLTQIKEFDGAVDTEKIKNIGSGIKIKPTVDSLADFSSGSSTDLGELEEKYGNPKDIEENEEIIKNSDEWYFSQKDPAWANEQIDSSGYYMKGQGCAITSLAMVLKKNGVNIDPGKLVRDGSFTKDGAINWPTSWGGVKLSSSTVHGPVNDSMIRQQLERGNLVIVFIKAINDSYGRGHYVVVIGEDDNGFIVNDPYWGAGIYLSVSKAKISSLYNSPVSLDQMIIYSR